MKLRRLALAAAAMIVVATGSSCKKDAETPKSKTELLTTGSWKITGWIVVSGSISYDYWKEADNCIKDNIVTFKADGSLTNDEGATKCDPSDDQVLTGAWAFAENETKIEYDGDLYTIESLSASTLKLSATTTSQGTTVVQTVTFSH